MQRLGQVRAGKQIDLNSILRKIGSLTTTQLHMIHHLLTSYIIAKQRGNQKAAMDVLAQLRKYGIPELSVLDADKLRRQVHRLIYERAKEETEEETIEKIGDFAIPDIETYVLSRANELEERLKTSISIEPHEIYVNQSDIEEETPYGEPVGYSVDLYLTINPYDKTARISIEYMNLLSNLSHYIRGAKVLDEEDVKKLIEQGALKELEKEDPWLFKKVKDYLEGWDDVPFMFLETDKCFRDVDACIRLPNGKYLNIVSADPYSMAVFWRSNPEMFGIYEIDRLSKKTGVKLEIDRIYHEIPAEYDVAAPSDAIVHAEGSIEVPLRTPEDEIKLYRLYKRIFDTLFLGK